MGTEIAVTLHALGLSETLAFSINPPRGDAYGKEKECNDEHGDYAVYVSQSVC
jgi:hypothetical protein